MAHARTSLVIRVHAFRAPLPAQRMSTFTRFGGPPTCGPAEHRNTISPPSEPTGTTGKPDRTRSSKCPSGSPPQTPQFLWPPIPRIHSLVREDEQGPTPVTAPAHPIRVGDRHATSVPLGPRRRKAARVHRHASDRRLPARYPRAHAVRSAARRRRRCPALAVEHLLAVQHRRSAADRRGMTTLTRDRGSRAGFRPSAR